MAAREEFTWVESAGTAKRIEPMVIASVLGDGYAQEAPAGIHDQKEVWTYQATNIDASVADDIEAFLSDGMGWKRFDWKTPRRTTALVFKCTAFSRTLGNEIDLASITATFEQVWEA